MKQNGQDNGTKRRYLENRDVWIYKRGDIYYATLNPYRGSEQGGHRPVLVVQNDIGNLHSPTLIIAPMTSRLYKKNLPTHYLVKRARGLMQPSLVLLEQIRTIDKSRVIGYMGKLEKGDLDKIDTMIRTSLGMYLTKCQAENQDSEVRQ